MKHYFYIFLCMACTACFAQKKHAAVQQKDAKITARFYADSLAKSNVDTVLVFTKSCVGCIQGINQQVYVFWKQNRQITGLTKFDNAGRHSIALKGEDLLAYFFNHQAEIQSQTLREPAYSLSHYRYTHIRVMAKNNVLLDREIPVTYFQPNDDMLLINWVYRIESILFNLERN